MSVLQKLGLDNTIFIDLELPDGFESVNPDSKYYKDSVLPVVIYESSRLLIKYPILNSFLVNSEVTSHTEVVMGIARDVDGLNPVKILQPDKMNLIEIEEKLFSASNPNPDKTPTPNSVGPGITFTISDLLANGVYFFTPLINKDNTCLGVSKLDKKLNRIVFSLTFDTKVVEVKTAVDFLLELKVRMESYISLQKSQTDKLMCYKCMRRLPEDLNSKGFIKVMTNKGEEKLICDSCLINY